MKLWSMKENKFDKEAKKTVSQLLVFVTISGIIIFSGILFLLAVVVVIIAGLVKWFNKKNVTDTISEENSKIIYEYSLGKGKSSLPPQLHTVPESIENYSRIQSGNDYNSKRDKLKVTFPHAYEFLSRLKTSPRKNIWIGTAVNAHIYKDDKFITYVKISPNSLIFSPRFNIKIAAETSDRSDLLFPELISYIINNHHGFNQGWGRELKNGMFGIYSTAPESFFSELFTSLETMK